MKISFRVLVLFITLSIYSSFAQGIIKGKVSENQTGAPLEADVKLFKSGDSTLVKGAKCESNGKFDFENINAGIYRLEVNFIEYSILTIENLNLTAGSTIILDTLKLKKQNISTDEILVEEDKGLLQFSADKKIFNVQESELTKGGTAIDVLKESTVG